MGKTFAYLIIFLLLAACAKREIPPRLLWPPPPDQPRLEFIGVFSSTDDFPKTNIQRFLDIVLGQRQTNAFQSPTCVLTDANDRVLVADSGGKTVKSVCFKSKSINALFAMSRFDAPTIVRIDGLGRFFVLDTKKQLIMVYSAEGKPLYAFGDKNSLGTAEGLVLHPKLDRLYLSDSEQHRIHVFDLGGTPLFSFGGEGESEGLFNKPQGMAFDSEQRLLVADSGNARIQIFTSEGEFLAIFGTTGEVPPLQDPVDVAVSSEGHVYILDQKNAALLTFSPEDELLLVTKTSSPTRHKMGFLKPTSLHIDARDRIYIADARNKRFSVWQYLSEEYLKEKPITDDDLQRLEAFRKKLQKEAEEAEKAAAR